MQFLPLRVAVIQLYNAAFETSLRKCRPVFDHNCTAPSAVGEPMYSSCKAVVSIAAAATLSSSEFPTPRRQLRAAANPRPPTPLESTAQRSCGLPERAELPPASRTAQPHPAPTSFSKTLVTSRRSRQFRTTLASISPAHAMRKASILQLAGIAIAVGQCAAFSTARTASFAHSAAFNRFVLHLQTPKVEKPTSVEPLQGTLIAERPLMEAQERPMGVWDASLLIAGNTVGAGMLALPESSKAVGFPTTVACLVGIWAVSQVSALAIARVAEESDESGSFGALAKQQLGDVGSVAVSFVNLLLNYMLLVAYTSQGANLLHQAFGSQQNALLCSAFAVFATAFTMAGNRVFEGISRAAMATMMLSFATIVTEKMPHVDQSLIFASGSTNENLCGVLPIFLVSMVFHNCVPVVAAQLRQSQRQMSRTSQSGLKSLAEKNPVAVASLLGSGIPLLMYVVYDACILGEAPAQFADGVDTLLSQSAAFSTAGSAVWVFSMAALLTSFWGTIVSQVEELKMVFRTATGGVLNGIRSTGGKAESLAAHTLCLVPPTIISTCYPDAFFDALRGAAIFGDLSLYFILPMGLLMFLRK